MSDGDFVQKFGEELPIPFIEKAHFDNDTIEIQTSIYLDMTHYGADNIDDVLEKMSPINSYVMFAYDREHTYSSASVEMLKDYNLKDVITGKRSVLSTLTSSVNSIMPSGSTSAGDSIATP